ncbi:MAG: ester cyclase [Altibacter sp.]|uniref:nuclear transport factor 2 family protein n=1 Tax=Altibacter sp. TaxID=2024823 RepID=UPI001D92951E|nr:nuclear transport factor 2 family protein [Altibacter sp.]MBZ0328300.1 ester cyclase [Altibacter sp.]
MNNQVFKVLLVGLCTISMFCACESKQTESEQHKDMAKQLFRSIYGGDPSLIDNLVSDDVISSYPIFEQLFGTKAINGRESLKNFATGFGERWNDANVTFHEAIAENKRVVLVWSFSATRVKTEQDSSVVAGKQYNWGGITIFHFNEDGKIIAEIGEESSPGPFERIK